MYRAVAQWRHIRHRIQEEKTPKKQVARETGINRPTINKMLAHEHPPSYGPRPPRYPKLGPYILAVERLLLKTVSCPPPTDLTIDIKESKSVLKVGLKWKFGGPVVARY